MNEGYFIKTEMNVVHMQFIYHRFTNSDHEYEVLRRQPVLSPKHCTEKKDDGAYEEPVNRRQNIGQIYHQAKFPSQEDKKQTEQPPPPNIYDEINEKKMHHRTQPDMVGFGPSSPQEI